MNLWHFHPAVKDRTVGQRAADRMKAVLATWAALGCVLVFILVWVLVNSYRVVDGGLTWDAYPWILLNLGLSCFAALQCFVLLIANKRGEQIAAQIAEHTLDNTTAIQELLTENTELTREIQANTAKLDEIAKKL